MKIRVASLDDAEEFVTIYRPSVEQHAISFEYETPSVDEMRDRVATTLQRLPWLVAEDGSGKVAGYVYAGKHKERAAYQWAVDTSVYVHEGHKGQGVGRQLYLALIDELRTLGYFHAFAGITLPNAGSVALHQSVGFMHLGTYPQLGFKMGRWLDVGRWHLLLQPLNDSPEPPRAFVAHG